jgi:nicotinamidase-related amidase
MSASRLGRLNISKTVLLLCDMQEKFSKSITHFDEIVETSGRLVQVAKHLDLPYFTTEHYPKGKYNLLAFVVFLHFYFYYYYYESRPRSNCTRTKVKIRKWQNIRQNLVQHVR